MHRYLYWKWPVSGMWPYHVIFFSFPSPLFSYHLVQTEERSNFLLESYYMFITKKEFEFWPKLTSLGPCNFFCFKKLDITLINLCLTKIWWQKSWKASFTFYKEHRKQSALVNFDLFAMLNDCCTLQSWLREEGRGGISSFLLLPSLEYLLKNTLYRWKNSLLDISLNTTFSTILFKYFKCLLFLFSVTFPLQKLSTTWIFLWKNQECLYLQLMIGCIHLLIYSLFNL